ncbi:MAG: T9SS type A sorting domain-containing protein [Bacteroidetes bacterium]|nr:T9SS type A sorting domain-containing protein [Bacteroidota bacterium]
MNRSLLCRSLLVFYWLTGSCLIPLQAQPTGSFEIEVPLGLETHILAFHVPLTYNPQIAYPLIVGLHGGGGTGTGYRNYLTDVAENFPAVVVCPDNNGTTFSGPAEQLILTAIDTASKLYHINLSKVVLNGYSMNGFEVYRLGLSSFYSFFGIIPYNSVMLSSWISQLNLNSDVPACICEGSLDSYYPLNFQIYNTLISNGGSAFFQAIPNVDHDLDAHFAPAVLKCMQVIDSLQGAVGTPDPENLMKMDIFPNPSGASLHIRFQTEILPDFLWVTDILGRKIMDSIQTLDLPSLKSGIYLLLTQKDDARQTFRFIKK